MFSLLTTKQGLLILLCGVTQTVSAQSTTADSLYNLPFDDMDRVFKTLPKTEQEQLAQAYLEKAKQENENYKKANGYYLHSFLASFTKPAVQYADSIIQVSQNIEQYPYSGLGYLEKGIQLYYTSRNDEALNHYLTANELFLKVRDEYNLLRIQHYMALLKNEVNRAQEALPIFEKNMVFFEKEEHRKKHKNQYLKSLFALGDSYNRHKMFDLAEAINIEGIHESRLAKDQMYPRFLLSYATTKILKKETELIIDTIEKALRLVGNQKTAFSSTYMYVSLLYQQNKDFDSAIDYLYKIDSIYNKHPESIIAAYEANEKLYKDFKQHLNLNEQLTVIDKLLQLDNILKLENRNLYNRIVKEYETPQLLLEKDTLITQLENKRRKNRIGFFILILLSLAFLTFLITAFQKNKRYRKRFQVLLCQEENSFSKTNKEKVSQATVNEIPQTLVKEILQKLEVFEQKQRFVKKKYTLESLARELKTNSSYLSKVINATQSSNFSTYINTLRIGYAVERLRKDTLFRTYTIEGIAQACGFNTSQAFSIAFYKQTGIYPAYFIKQLHKQNPLEN